MSTTTTTTTTHQPLFPSSSPYLPASHHSSLTQTSCHSPPPSAAPSIPTHHGPSTLTLWMIVIFTGVPGGCILVWTIWKWAKMCQKREGSRWTWYVPRWMHGFPSVTSIADLQAGHLRDVRSDDEGVRRGGSHFVWVNRQSLAASSRDEEPDHHRRHDDQLPSAPTQAGAETSHHSRGRAGGSPSETTRRQNERRSSVLGGDPSSISSQGSDIHTNDGARWNVKVTRGRVPISGVLCSPHSDASPQKFWIQNKNQAPRTGAASSPKRSAPTFHPSSREGDHGDNLSARKT